LLKPDHTIDTFDLFLEITRQLRQESDRGSVIVGTSILDGLLSSYIKAKLAPSPNKCDELFDCAYAPLSSFSVKIDLAHRLGLLTHATRSSLHLIRRLRNDFAHSSRAANFADTRVQDRIRELFKLNQPILEGFWDNIANSDSVKFISMKTIRPTQTSVDFFIQTIGWRGTYEFVNASTAVGMNIDLQNIE